MRFKDQVTEIYKVLKSKNVEISREQVSEVLESHSQVAHYKLSRGEPFEIYKIGNITPKLFSKRSNLNNEDFTTIKFQFKIHSQVKSEAKEKIPNQ